MTETSTIHWGDYGCGSTQERQQRYYRDGNMGKRWHQSLKPDEITKLFVIWGIVGRRRTINPVVRLMPYFDRCPGLRS